MSYLVQWRTKSQEELINRVKSNLDTIKMNFFEIGGYLYEAYSRRFYHGYDTITEFAKENFGFEKTLTYNLINVFRTFREGDSYLPNQCVTHLNQTQLIALCSCQAGRNQFATIISPQDTVKDVKRAVKIYNSLSIIVRGSMKANNLKEFFEEFDYKAPEENKETEIMEDFEEDYNEDFSVQAEKQASKWKPAPVRDYFIETMGEYRTNKIGQKLSDAILNLKECIDLINIGCDYIYKLREAKDQCQKLFNNLYYGTDEQNI